MNKLITLFAGCFFLAANLFSQATNWPTWRGANWDGVALTGTPPTEWSETKNVKWKVPLEGTGASTPIIWGDVLFYTTSVNSGREPAQDRQSTPGGMMSTEEAMTIYEFYLVAINKNTGKLIWKTKLTEEVPFERTHVDGSWASDSPVTDGENIYAYMGSRGLFCVDMQGNVKWSRDFGQKTTQGDHGEGSSAAVYKNMVAILWDHEGQSAIHVMDKTTGKDIWVKNRDEISTWSPPLFVEYNGKAQIVTNGTNRIRSYDAQTGDILWETSGFGQLIIPQPMYQEGKVYLMCGYRTNMLYAIDLAKATGDITNNGAIIWKHDAKTSYVPSATLVGGKIYYLWGTNGSLTCADATTGKIFYTGANLPGMGKAYSSPVAAGGNLYFLGTSGKCYTVKQGDTFEILSENILDDSFRASPIVSGNNLYLKGNANIYCIGL